jgi:hypothetical protein
VSGLDPEALLGAARERAEAPTDPLEHLRQANARLSRQLAEAKASKAELVQAVYRAASDAISGLSIPPVPKPEPDRRRRTAEVAVAVVSDLQLAKVTPTYNSEVCERRMELYAHKVVQLTDIQRADHPVRELRVWILGDVVEGEMIFAGQAHRIDAGLYRQVALDGPRILSNFLRTMLRAFDRVHVSAVIGNHGAVGGAFRKDHDPETNADRMVYRITQQIMANEHRLTWNIPDGAGERHWYAVDQIGTYRTLLFHGDQIRGGGFAGFPFYGAAKRIWGWKTGAIKQPFDDAFCGHWHQNVTMTLNSTILRVNGTTESDNTWANEELAVTGRPSQRMQFVHPERGVTSEHIVWLDENN